ncbi:hypothetical protein Vretimale_720, partial [Volvox reticuliferus]
MYSSAGCPSPVMSFAMKAPTSPSTYANRTGVKYVRWYSTASETARRGRSSAEDGSSGADTAGSAVAAVALAWSLPFCPDEEGMLVDWEVEVMVVLETDSVSEGGFDPAPPRPNAE